MVALEMADDRLNLDPLFQCIFEPGLVTVRMWRFAFLRNRQLLYTPSPAAVFLLLEGLIKTPICCNLLRWTANVLPDGSDHLSQSLYVGHVVLIFPVGKNQTIVIFGEGNNGAELTIGVMLAFLDDGNIRFMQRINSVLGRFTEKHLFRLINDSLPQRDQSIEFFPCFLEAPTVKAVDDPGTLRNDVVGHLLECLDRFFPPVRIFPVELLDPEEQPLSTSAVCAKGFQKGNLLAYPFDLSVDLFANTVQEIGIRWVGNVLGLSRRIHGYPLGLDQTHFRPGLKKEGFNLLHPFCSDSVPELYQRGGVQYLPALKTVEPTEALPVRILMERFNGLFIRTIVSMFQKMDTDHQADGFPLTAQWTSKHPGFLAGHPSQSAKRRAGVHVPD